MNDASNTTIDILVHYGYRVAVIYTAGGITVNITKAGRGQECSGLDADNMLELMVARLVDAGEVPISALSAREVQDAGNKVEAQPKASGALREVAEEGIAEGVSGSNLEHEEAKGKAKKVAR